MLRYFTRRDLFLFRCDLQRKAWQKKPKRYWCLQKRCNCCFEIGHIVTRRFRHTFCRKWQKLKLHMFPAVYFFCTFALHLSPKRDRCNQVIVKNMLLVVPLGFNHCHSNNAPLGYYLHKYEGWTKNQLPIYIFRPYYIYIYIGAQWLHLELVGAHPCDL